MKISKTFTPLENKDPKINGFLTGFSLIELILVVAIVAILAAAMIPMITSARQKARAARIVQLADTLRDACILYHSDTGAWSFEASNAIGPLNHRLSQNDGRPGWDGPYIERSLSEEDAFPARFVQVWSSMFLGFDLDGDGTVDKGNASPGNCLYMRGFPETTAKALNDQVDINIPGNWMWTGKVRYIPIVPGEWGTVFMYLTGGS